MLLNQGFVIPNYENHSLDSASHSLFHRVLNERLAGNRQHFLGDCLGRGKHPSAEAGCGNYRLHDFCAIRHNKTILEGRGENTKGREYCRQIGSWSLHLCWRLNGFPFRFSHFEFRMGNQEVPDHGLKRFRVRSYGLRIDDGNEDAGVRDLSGVTSVAADNATNGGTNLASVFESAHEVSADVLLSIATPYRKNKDHVCVIQPGPTKPIGITRVPALIIHPCSELRCVIRRRVGFDLCDFAEITHGVRRMARPPSNAKEEEPARTFAQNRTDRS